MLRASALAHLRRQRPVTPQTSFTTAFTHCVAIVPPVSHTSAMRGASTENTSAATLAFLGKLVAKSGVVEVSSVSRLLPSRMSKSLKEHHNGDLAGLVDREGGAFGLGMAGDGNLIVSKGAKAPAASPPSAKPTRTASPPVRPGEAKKKVTAPSGGSSASAEPASTSSSAKAEPAPPEVAKAALVDEPKATPAATVEQKAKPAAVDPPKPPKLPVPAPVDTPKQPPKATPSPTPKPAEPKPAQTQPASSRSGKASPPPPPPPSFKSSRPVARGGPAAPPPPKAPSLPNLPRLRRGAPAEAPAGGDFNSALRTWRSPQEIVDGLMEYVPTYWIRARHVHNALPHEMKELYTERMKLVQFLRKFQFYFDGKQTPEGPFVKVRDTCNHPKKGFADDRYASSLQGELATQSPSDSTVTTAVQDKTLEGRVRAFVTPTFGAIADLDRRLPQDIQAHADFDAKLGITTVLEKNPQYFQIVDGRVRLRPIGVAPNALDELSVETSPEPELMRQLMKLVPDSSDDAVRTSSLFAELTPAEKARVKEVARSFPRFLRLHGRVLSVSPDNLSVRRFHESLPDDMQQELDNADGSGVGVSAPSSIFDDEEIVGKRLPGETSFDASAVEVAIKELHDALPLLQAVPLDDAVFMLPAAMRQALKGVDLKAELLEYPSYFSLWEFPDDTSLVVLQRASLDTPEVDIDELVSSVHPLIPQGGIDADRLMRKIPLHIQRYFYRHGLKRTLSGLGQHFFVAGNKVMAIGGA